MGHKCDVCDVGDATIFCFADQAVMCEACDLNVHTANKLVNKHERVTLGKDQDTSKCDICTEAPAVMFCSEDRALICRRCDLMIHTANELTAQHHRYLLSPVSVGLRALPAPPLDAHADGASGHAPSSTNNGPRNGTHYHTSTSTAMYGNHRYKDPGPSGVPLVPMDKGKAPAIGGYMGGREGSLGTLISNSSAVHSMTGAGLLSNSLDSMRSNAGAEALLRGVAHRTSNGNDDGAYSGSNPRSHNDANVPSSSNWGSGGRDSLDLDRMFARSQANSFTLAADLLGVPSMSTNLTAKDVDVSYSLFDVEDLDGEISALLEVPDIDAFNMGPSSTGSRPPSFDMPGAYRGMQFANMGSSSGYGGMPPARGRRSLDLLGGDGVVPDLAVPNMSFQAAKRQRT